LGLASRCVLLQTAALLAVAGCAQVVTERQPAARLPPAKMSSDAVALDVAFVRLPVADEAAYEKIWRAADEQPFDVDARRELATNGLRVGILGSELPAELRQRLDAKPELLEELSSDATELDMSAGRRHLQLRAGRRSEIRASRVYPSLPVLINEEGRVHGQQLQKAQCQFTLRSFPQGDGQVRLHLVPEIAHGEEKRRYVGNEGSFLFHVGRDRLVLDRLQIEARLAPGEWLILSTTPEVKGLGECFFVDAGGTAAERTLVLIRLAQTQLDALFAPEQTPQPLTTPTD
jgi:hypothetical protein